MAKRRQPPSSKPAKGPQTTPVEVVFINPLFKIVLIVLIVFFFVMLLIALGIAFVEKPNELQKQLFTFCSHGSELVLGAIVGLISGKSIDAFAFRVERPPE